LKRLRAEQEAQKRDVAKLKEDAGSHEQDAGGGLAFLIASASAKPALSASSQREMDEKRLVQLQQQVEDQQRMLHAMFQHMEAHSGFQFSGVEQTQVKEAQTKLADLKAELTRRKSGLHESQSQSGAGGDNPQPAPEDGVGC
jgi:hypothetical protein